MLVVSDGDLIVNEVDNKTGNPFPMGYDRFSKHQYGNQDFVFNALNYLLDENGLIVAKAKSIRLRPLDTLKTRNKHTQWQVINLLLPLTLLVFVGLLRFYFIRMKYTSF